MKDYEREYARWLNAECLTPEERAAVAAMTSPEERELAFGRRMEFGTAGLRSAMAPGPGNMNDRTVAHATQGMADLILSHGGAEMGYILSPKYQKNGYMTEAMEYFVPYSFEVLNLKHLRLRIMEKNTPSRRLAEKFGFLLSEIKKDYMFIRGESRNVCFYYLYNKL